MRTEQIRLAKAANISPEELDGVNLIWYAIGRIERMKGYINLIEAELEELRKDKARLDWLADPSNMIGNVTLPTECVQRNPCSLRAAIDDAMRGEK